MTRPAIPDVVRLLLVALGVCCLIVPLFALWEFREWTTADGVVEVYPVVAYERTNMHTRVAYTRENGFRTVVMSSDVPSNAREGDHLTVFYDPERLKSSVVLTFYTVWSIPVYATILGVVLMSLALIARSRCWVVFSERHENAA